MGVNHYKKIMEQQISNLCNLTDLHMFLNEIDRAYGSKVAYRYHVEDMIVDKTYSELTCDVKSIASWMVNKGYYGKHIAIIGPTSYKWVATFLGIICSANVVLPIDRLLSAKEIKNIFESGDVDIVFASDDFEGLLQEIEQDEDNRREVFRFDGHDFQDILATSPVQLPAADPDSLAEILFTSGTTGISK